MVKGTVDQHFDKEICELSVVKSEHRFREFIQTNPAGIAMLPIEDIDSKKLQMHPHAWDFAKWLKAHAPEIVIHVMPADEHLVLHSADIWLPLIYLANNVALPIHLNLVASYLYD